MRIDFNQLQTNHIEDPAAQAAGAKSGSSKATAEIPAGGITFGHSEDNLFNRNLTKNCSTLFILRLRKRNPGIFTMLLSGWCFIRRYLKYVTI